MEGDDVISAAETSGPATSSNQVAITADGETSTPVTEQPTTTTTVGESSSTVAAVLSATTVVPTVAAAPTRRIIKVKPYGSRKPKWKPIDDQSMAKIQEKLSKCEHASTSLSESKSACASASGSTESSNSVDERATTSLSDLSANVGGAGSSSASGHAPKQTRVRASRSGKGKSTIAQRLANAAVSQSVCTSPQPGAVDKDDDDRPSTAPPGDGDSTTATLNNNNNNVVAETTKTGATQSVQQQQQSKDHVARPDAKPRKLLKRPQTATNPDQKSDDTSMTSTVMSALANLHLRQASASTNTESSTSYGTPPVAMLKRQTTDTPESPRSATPASYPTGPLTAEETAHLRRLVANCGPQMSDAITVTWNEFTVTVQRVDVRSLAYSQVIIAYRNKPKGRDARNSNNRRQNNNSNTTDRAFWNRECLLAYSTNRRRLQAAVCEAVESLRCQPTVKADAEVKEPVSKLSVPFLESESIYPIKKPSQRFASAVYFCRVCDYHLSSVSHARGHMLTDEHRNAIEIQVARTSLNDIPAPSLTHVASLDDVLTSNVLTHARSPRQLEACHQLAGLLTTLFKQKLHEGCWVRLYGSSCTGTALRVSDVNLELMYPMDDSTINHATALISAAGILEAYPTMFTDVRKEFNIRWPCVRLVAQRPIDDGEEGQSECFTVVLSVRNQQAVNIAELLGTYTAVSPTYRQLCVVVRYWAKLCGFDNHLTGGLPPYALDIMILCYLQHANLLPVLHQFNDPPSPDEDADQSTMSVDGGDGKQTTNQPNNDQLEAEMVNYERDVEKIRQSGIVQTENHRVCVLLLGFLRYYNVEFDLTRHVIQIRQRRAMCREAKGWSRKKFAIEDPFLLNKNLSQLSNNMFDYVMHCFRATYMYLAIPQTRDHGPLFVYADKKIRLSDTFVEMIGDILKPPADPAPSVAPSRSTEMATQKLKATLLFMQQNVGESKLNESVETAVLIKEEVVKDTEAPSCPDPTLLRPEDIMKAASNSNSVVEDSKDIDDGNGSITDRSYTKEQMDEIKLTVPRDDELIKRCQGLGILAAENQENEEAMKTENIEEPKHPEAVETSIKSDTAPVQEDMDDDEDDESASFDQDSEATTYKQSLTDAAVWLNKSGMPLRFEFSVDHFADGKHPEHSCQYCGQADHEQNHCPEKQLPPLVDLPVQISTPHSGVLSHVLHFTNNSTMVSQGRARWQSVFVRDIQMLLHDQLAECHNHGCRLDLFGSSVNGFGFEDSDIDLCLRFDWPTLPEDLEPKRVIRRVARLLTRDPARRFIEVWPVCSAKVPIVKFKTRYEHVEADISLYNTLALRNTEMIRTYADIDARVPVLGRMIKQWARTCQVGDASKGSLSSYAYILMLIHYLQRTVPPVLPVLQEIYENNAKPPESFFADYTIDGWNTYFFPDVGRVQQALSANPNTNTVAQLFVGFLRFYTETFAYDEDVVQIRRCARLTKFEKLWTDKPMAIEDPFDLNHNLSSALSKRMFAFIRRSLIQARMIFGQEEVLQQIVVNHQQRYDRITQAMLSMCSIPDVPRDRQCKLCHRVGHYVENCPYKKGSRKFMDDSEGEEDTPTDNVRTPQPQTPQQPKPLFLASTQQQQQQQQQRSSTRQQDRRRLPNSLSEMQSPQGGGGIRPQSHRRQQYPPLSSDAVNVFLNNNNLNNSNFNNHNNNNIDLQRSLSHGDNSAYRQQQQQPNTQPEPTWIQPKVSTTPLIMPTTYSCRPVVPFFNDSQSTAQRQPTASSAPEAPRRHTAPRSPIPVGEAVMSAQRQPMMSLGGVDNDPSMNGWRSQPRPPSLPNPERLFAVDNLTSETTTTTIGGVVVSNNNNNSNSTIPHPSTNNSAMPSSSNNGGPVDMSNTMMAIYERAAQLSQLASSHHSHHPPPPVQQPRVAAAVAPPAYFHGPYGQPPAALMQHTRLPFPPLSSRHHPPPTASAPQRQPLATLGHHHPMPSQHPQLSHHHHQMQSSHQHPVNESPAAGIGGGPPHDRGAAAVSRGWATTAVVADPSLAPMYRMMSGQREQLGHPGREAAAWAVGTGWPAVSNNNNNNNSNINNNNNSRSQEYSVD